MSQGGSASNAGERATSLNDRAIRVFEFLVELQRLRTRVTRSLDAYRSVLWYSTLPNSPEITTPGTDVESGVWLTVERVERDVPPSPPESLSPWLTATSLRDSRADRPSLSPRAVSAVEVVNSDGSTGMATVEMLLDEHPEIIEELDVWLPVWRNWADRDRARAAVAEVYHQVYAIYQDSHALAESYEVLLAFGYLT